MPINKAWTPSTLETIDGAFYRWVDEQLNLSVRTNKDFKKVPVIWSGAERAYQLKRSKEARDDSETMILPVITIERSGIQKDPSRMGPFGNNVYSNSDRRKNNFLVKREIQADKTKNFANAESLKVMGYKNSKHKSKKVIYEFSFIPTPTWVHVSYVVKLITEYQTQMNDLVTPFVSRYGNAYSFNLEDKENAYEGFISQEFTQNNNGSSLEEEERRFETEIQIRVEGFIIGSGDNQEQQTVAIRENQVKVRFGKEETFFIE
tara:strand:- start:859 stop:1644 length:786 start_codon:yes stop_codon:yes gene_type:complete